ncbi:MAG: TlpA family protein disulfide reductase [Acidimicrobiales bacterium]
MSKASARQRPLRPMVTARNKAEAQRRQRNRLLLGGGFTVLVVLAALVISLHITQSNARSTSPNARSGTSNVSLPVGTTAPNGTITTLSGTTEKVGAFRGRPTLIWFVTTWCSSCQAGTQVMAQNVSTLAADGVRVVEVENYADLGQKGDSMAVFAKSLAGGEFSNSDWTFGEASATLTHAYNPQAYLDIYYLINAQGKITYVNSSPGSTMPQLLRAAKALV